jgi:Bacterial capsule synthesis protein PGA_cap
VRAVILSLRAGAVVALAALLAAVIVDGTPRAQSVSATKGQEQREPETKPVRGVSRVGRPGVAGEVISFVAVGDIVMGSTPRLPPDGGRSFFDDVASDLAGDVVIGNLEGTLSTGGTSRCGPGEPNCFAFQTPPSYAKWFARAGFTIMNVANNHAYDFGPTGQRQTIAALDSVDLPHTGRPGQITALVVNGVRINVVGFAPYPWAQSLTDIPAAQRLIRKAAATSALVVAVLHAGAEGADRQHVTPGVEQFLGENRGDSMRFAHAIVDAGADLVVASGPHVLRGMEWYKRKLIAYSLGNFGGYGVFSLGGPLSVSAILRVDIRGDGTFESGVVVPTILVGKGVPARDPAERAHGMIRTLSREDFGAAGVKLSSAGIIAKPS